MSQEEHEIPFCFEEPVPVLLYHEQYLSSNLTKLGRKVPVFVLKGMSEHCMKIMQDLRHPNILKLEAIVYNHEDVSASTVLVQQHDGNLFKYIEKLVYSDIAYEKILKLLRIIIKQLLEGLEFLMDNSRFHGLFSLQKTYYIMEDKVPVVKLANFVSGIGASATWTLQESWSGDFKFLGVGLESLIEPFEESHRNLPKAFTREIIGLAALLKNTTIDPLEMKCRALQQPFFWDGEKRASVFTFDFPRWNTDSIFRKMVHKTFNCPASIWNLDAYYGLLKKMKAHRSKILAKDYNGEDKQQYLRFVSGSYIHEDELLPLQGGRSVDKVFREKHPDLFANLMKTVAAADDERKKQALKQEALKQ